MNNKLMFLGMLFLLLVPSSLYGQIDTLITSKYPTLEYLNEVVRIDTSGIGAFGWQRQTRGYVLERNGIYPLQVTIPVPNGRTLKIRTEAGTGRLAEIWLYDAPGSTRPPGYMATVGGNIYLQDVNISGYQEDVWGEVDGVQGGCISTPTAYGGGTACYYIDNCILKSWNGNHLRTDGQAKTIKVTNCIFSDLGNNATSNFGAGKAVDLRANQIDTLYIVNNTIINGQDRIIRHLNSTGPIKNLWFNNNTIVNMMAYHGLLDLGMVDQTGLGAAQLKNNLFIDPFYLGNDTAVVRMAEFSDPQERDSVNSDWRMCWILPNPNTVVNWEISGNYYTKSDSGEYMLIHDGFGPLGPPYYRYEGDPMTWGMKARMASQPIPQDTINAFRKIAIAPVNVPQLPTNQIRWFYRERSLGGAGKGKGGSYDPYYIKETDGIWTYDYNRKSMRYYTDTLDCNFYSDAVISGVGHSRWHRLGTPTAATGMATDIIMCNRWNLVSCPREVLDCSVCALFPYAFGCIAYGWPGYPTVPCLEIGYGYWVYNTSATTVTIPGVAPGMITIKAQYGWNMIGSRAWPVQIANLQVSGGNYIAGGVGYIYGWGAFGCPNSYIPVPQIDPGMGVWVYVIGPTTDSTGVTITFPCD